MLHVEHVMGMPVRIDVRDRVDVSVVGAVVARLHRVDSLFST